MPGDRFVVVRVRGVDVALTICEDLWQDGGPFAVAGRAEVGLVANINGSPYERNKDDVRLPLGRRRAAEAGATVAYVNMVGAQDELVYDGDSFVVAPDGTVLARAAQYEQTLLVVDLDLPGRRGTVTGGVLGMTVRAACRLGRAGGAPRPGRRHGRGPDGRRGGGLAGAGRRHPRLRPQERLPLGGARPVRRDRLGGHRGGRRGRDRRRVASSASRCRRRTPPEHSKDDAAELARRLGSPFRTVPIAPMVDGVPGRESR